MSEKGDKSKGGFFKSKLCFTSSIKPKEIQVGWQKNRKCWHLRSWSDELLRGHAAEGKVLSAVDACIHVPVGQQMWACGRQRKYMEINASSCSLYTSNAALLLAPRRSDRPHAGGSKANETAVAQTHRRPMNIDTAQQRDGWLRSLNSSLVDLEGEGMREHTGGIMVKWIMAMWSSDQQAADRSGLDSLNTSDV